MSIPSIPEPSQFQRLWWSSSRNRCEGLASVSLSRHSPRGRITRYITPFPSSTRHSLVSTPFVSLPSIAGCSNCQSFAVQDKARASLVQFGVGFQLPSPTACIRLAAASAVHPNLRKVHHSYRSSGLAAGSTDIPPGIQYSPPSSPAPFETQT